MPQFTRFPPLPPGDHKAAMARFLRFVREWPAAGEPFRTQRTRLKRTDLWSRERYPDLLRFFYAPHVDPVPAPPLVLAIQAAEDDDAAIDLVADRLWNINPLLAKTVFERLKARVNSLNELIKFIDSFAYPGNRLPGPQLRQWFEWAHALGWLRPVGVGLGLGERGEAFLPRCDEIDVEEFLDEDEDEPMPPMPEGVAAPAPATPEPQAPAPAPVVAAPAPAPAPAAVAPAPVSPPSAVPTAGPDPTQLDRAIPIHRIAPLADQLDGTADHLAAWWREASTEAPTPWWRQVGVDGETWMEDPEAALFRLAVAVGLRSPAAGVTQPEAAFLALDQAGVLEALYAGTAPTGASAALDPMALLRTSLIARRFADHPELAADLERCPDAAAAFTRLDAALGRGLFGLELFVLLRALSGLGVLRLKGMHDYTAVPERGVRDTLFRLGFLGSPYAPDAEALAAAAAAARRATGDTARPEALLAAFAARAGCAYGCPRRATCGLACRERLDLS